MTKPLLEQNNCHVRSRPKIDQDLSATKTDRMKEVITSDQEWEKNPFYGFRGDCSRKGLNTTVFGYTVGGGADDRPAGRLCCCGRRNSPAWDKRAINQWTDRRRGRSVFQSSGPDKPMLLMFVVYLTARYGTPTFCSTFFFLPASGQKESDICN